MDIFVQLPETMTLPETVFSVILGNLLENSLDACCDIQSGERRITVRGRYETGAVYFDISNNYEGELRRGKSGELLTTKKHGSGLGLLSVSHIVKNRNGIMELNTENGIGNNAYTDGAPRQIMEGVQDVAAGYGFTAYLMEDGTVRIQGNNSYGQAGNGTTGGTVHMAEAGI